jgi:hypothetical protein
VLSQDSEMPIAYERPSHADPLASGAVLSDLVCAALAGTHEVEASSSSSPACPPACDSGYQLISTVQPFHRLACEILFHSAHTVLPSYRQIVKPGLRPISPLSQGYFGGSICFSPEGLRLLVASN